MVCRSIDKSSFIRALQLHIFEYGFPSLIVSDNGSPIVSGVEEIILQLSDPEVKSFLDSHGIKCMKFHPYPANASKLGGFIESMVKQVKRIVSSSIRNNVLSEWDFNFLISEAKMLINKRPIALKKCSLSAEFR